jgi:ubiquinone/menaquinone biosynthesis C-methylase UbiE
MTPHPGRRRAMFFRNLSEAPDRGRALANYARLAKGYDGTCGNIVAIRQAAIEALGLRRGETVFDVACGTGTTLLPLAERVSPEGRVIGIEQSPEMAMQARARTAHVQGIEIAVGSVEDLCLRARADAMLFSYTHDVLQSPAALARLREHARPGCRVAVVGIRMQPWTWGFALNIFTLVRARHYFTAYRGLDAPWALLAEHCPGLTPVRHFHWGTSYLAVGRFSG